MTTRHNACVVAAILLAVSTAQADIINVPGDQPTIQAGIDAAVNGDEIIVAEGEYFENINFLGKAVTLRSTDPNDPVVVVNTIINGGGVGSVVTCISGEWPNTVLSGFTITGGNGGGMYNLSSSPTVTNCTFSGNTASSGGGMFNNGGSPTVTNCTFEGNSAISSGGGMFNNGGSPTVTNCTFSGNLSVYGGGMRNSGNPTVTNCTFEGNSATASGGGMYNSGGPLTVIGCTFNGNSAPFGGGLYVSSGVSTVTNSVFTSNMAAGGGGIFVNQGALLLSGSEFCDNTATHITGSWTDHGNNSFCPLCDDASGDVLEVPAAYPTIQSAINAACDGAEVIVAPGTYYETITLGGKPITVRSTDPMDPVVVANTVIDGTGNRHVVQCVSGEGPDTVIDGFTITGGDATGPSPDNFGGGMFNASSSPTVINCTFSGNTATSGGGMYNDSSSPTVTNCTFEGNSATSRGGGMYNRNGGSPTVTNCTFTGNTAFNGGGMANFFDSSPTVTNCTFTGNTAYNGGGMYNQSEGVTIAESFFCDNTPTHVSGNWNDGGNNEFCPLCDKSSGDVLNVPAQYPTIQEAVNAACDGSVVVVAPGTYFENINLAGNAITLRSSDGPGVTIVEGTVLCANGEGPDTVLDGFTITGGGGMSNLSSSPTVTNCIFSGSFTAMYNAGGNPTVTNCTFIGNVGDIGGGMLNIDASPTVTNCTFSDNSAELGGGMANWPDSHPTVTNCTFSGNSGSPAGGGMFNATGSSPTVTNCTFTGNTAGIGGGIFGAATISNCIVWDNSFDELSGGVAVSYSNVQGGWPGTGNIDADPLFVDPLNGDFRLSAGSPCIDAANNIAVPAGITTDLDGNPRFVDDANTKDTGLGQCPVDMGAYEFSQGDACSACPWDCGDGDGQVGVVDFLALLANWGGSQCDFDGDGVGITDFLAMLESWGPCP